ncbi:hypothetical protein CVT26_002224 [Gymnopilus dilepis]|uniref:Ribonuclease H n=1 Tax=Gymnopilus dilepis TaxID=231916 RepID=A0A409VBH3_9AGAR|nr:hypothetical protein CVT26_002224 [Gymnopilus dilepis]
MAPRSKGGLYAVRKGRAPGIYSTWEDCKAQIEGFSGAEYKKFTSSEEANSFMSAGLPRTSAPSLPLDSKPVDSKGKKRAFGPEVSDTTGWDIVYSDGACKGNGKPGSIAGIGVWWGANDPRNLAERCPGDQTNNRAELIAILRVLETTPLTKKPLLIRTDSQYSIKCFKSWIMQWQKKDWKTSAGEHVKNAGIIRCISKQLDIRAKSGQKVVLEYVKGHSGDTGNDGADALANRGALLAEMTERDWKALEEKLDKELTRTPNSGDVSRIAILAPDHLPEDDDMEAPVKVQKISRAESFSTSKFVAQHSISKPPIPSPKESSSLISSDNSSKPSSSQSIVQPSVSPAKSDQLKSIHKPIIPIQAKDVNISEYEGCLLDEDDLADEISD